METLITADDVQARVRALADEIRRDHPDGVHLIGVLKGSFIFLSDLARAIAEDSDGKGVTMDFIAVSSYGSSANSSGQVQLLKDLDAPIQGRDVVIVEDIIDTGLTLTYLHKILGARKPRTPAHGLPPEQAVAPQGGRERWSTWASRSKTVSWSATGSTTPKPTGRSPSSASSSSDASGPYF